MSRGRRLAILAAGAGSAVFPFLWAAAAGGVGLSPRWAASGWLLAGCLLLLAAPPGPAAGPEEAGLLAALLAPGLFVTLAVLGRLRAAEAWSLAARVLLALGLHAALAGLAGRLPARGRGPARLASALGVPLLFVLWLWRSSLLLAAALPAVAAGLLLLLRRAHD